MQNILVRADSSSKIGLGHIMRDLVLCKQFKGAKITFASRGLKGNINNKVIEAGHSLKILHSDRKSELLKVIKKLHVDLLIVDHYDIDYNYEKSLKKHSAVKIMALDDTYKKHYCDILLNHNISADKTRYKSLVPRKCEIRCGEEYTLLRDEFHIEKNKKRTKDKRSVFIALGGTDDNNISKKVIKVLKEFKNIDVNLVTTSSNKNLNTLKKYIRNKKWIKLHVDSNSIAKLMRKSSFAIVSPSVILNEVHFMKLPFIAIKTADNQDDIYRYLKRKKLPALKKFNTKQLQKKIKTMLR